MQNKPTKLSPLAAFFDGIAQRARATANAADPHSEERWNADCASRAARRYHDAVIEGKADDIPDDVLAYATSALTPASRPSRLDDMLAKAKRLMCTLSDEEVRSYSLCNSADVHAIAREEMDRRKISPSHQQASAALAAQLEREWNEMPSRPIGPGAKAAWLRQRSNFLEGRGAWKPSTIEEQAEADFAAARLPESARAGFIAARVAVLKNSSRFGA